MQTVVLFDCNVDRISPPWGCLQATALLDRSKYDVRIITCRDYPDYEREILRQTADAVCFGVSCITSKYVRNGLQMSMMVKDAYPAVPVIWGGWQAITLPRLTLQSQYVDYVCTGQGERTLAAFLEALDRGPTALRSIPGLGGKYAGEAWFTPCAEIEAPDAFPMPDLDAVPLSNHVESGRHGAERVLEIVTSTGCPHRCGFCCEQHFCGRLWRGMRAENVIAMLVELQRRLDLDAVKVGDSNFFVSERRVADICRGIGAAGLTLKLLQANGRADTLVRYKDQTWKLMADAGLRSLLIGSESANDATLRSINKDITVAETLELCRIAKRHGIAVVLSNVIGFPGADGTAVEQFDELRNFYACVRTTGVEADFAVFFYTPYPGSPLYDESLRRGFTPPDTLEGWASYEITRLNVPWASLSRRDARRIETFRFLCRLLGSDTGSYVRRLPAPLRAPAHLLDSGAQALAQWRLRHDCLSFPIDRHVYVLAETIFRSANRRLNFLNIGGTLNDIAVGPV